MARLSEAALARLDDARTRAAELTRELSDPATFEDARRAAELGREQVELSGVVEQYEKYRSLLNELEAVQDLLNDGADDELRALAQEEVEGIEPQLDEIVDGL